MFPYVAYNNVFHNLAKDACQWYGSVVSRVWFKVVLWIGVTSAWSQSLGSLLVDCWKMRVMMGAICSAVSLRTIAGSSSGPVALFWLRFFNCLIIPFVPISRGGMLEYNEGYITCYTINNACTCRLCGERQPTKSHFLSCRTSTLASHIVITPVNVNQVVNVLYVIYTCAM